MSTVVYDYLFLNRTKIFFTVDHFQDFVINIENNLIDMKYQNKTYSYTIHVKIYYYTKNFSQHYLTSINVENIFLHNEKKFFYQTQMRIFKYFYKKNI